MSRVVFELQHQHRILPIEEVALFHPEGITIIMQLKGAQRFKFLLFDSVFVRYINFSYFVFVCSIADSIAPHNIEPFGAPRVF